MRLSTTDFARGPIIGLCMLLSSALSVNAQMLQPYKEALFAYGRVLETADGGDYRVVDYQEQRDINGRDQIPERRVKRAYVSLGVKGSQVNETIAAAGHAVNVTRVGPASGAAFSVIFIHGRGGDRRLGVNDYSFGGNFNRLKNLAVENGGVYFAPSVRSFDAAGVANVAALVAHAKSVSGGKPVVLACASMGSFICWGIARLTQAPEMLDGMIIMGGPVDGQFFKSAAHKARVPIFFSHGSADSVYPAQDQVALYRKLKAEGYPARLVLFQSGSHGTPVRMTDWRDALNWIGQQSAR
ncbi:dienelactone hydrolase family protein [Pararhizobium antarcticum]|uniref:Phospholipase n=1 Tax=Pararhizobium antarcticum TaxID=1798805 RepID=A0A657LQJ3_9HYPH|nr:dienelactone hydrolase family protein [Pararhizobium antarcticum]OJF91801.1 phospholipase [Rhizobium sp. 58]OJF93723.1 phospholipase [Pararhizobium antarcticum]